MKRSWRDGYTEEKQKEIIRSWIMMPIAGLGGGLIGLALLMLAKVIFKF